MGIWIKKQYSKHQPIKTADHERTKA